MKKLTLFLGILLSVTANAQMALDQTTNGTNKQIYKTIVFANGNLSNNPSYNYTGNKNIDEAFSDKFGGVIEFWRNMGGEGTFVQPNQQGGDLSTTVPNEMVGGNIISWNQSRSLKKNLQSATNTLGINYTGEMKRTLADTNNDGLLDAQLTTYTLPSGSEAQTRGFQIGDVAIFFTPEVVSYEIGITLLVSTRSFKKLNNNYMWEYSLDGPTGWGTSDIPDWIVGGLATEETKTQEHKIYPNPVKDILHFSEEVSNIKITDIAGRTVKEFSVKGKSVDVSRLPSGVYIISTTTKEGNTVTKKIVKE